MGFIKKIWQWLRRAPEEESEYEFVEWNEVVYDREELQINDPVQRHEYVKNCLEQIVEATQETDSLQQEYNIVTSYLKDMEEIEALPLEERQQLEAAAAKIEQLKSQKSSYLERSNQMSEAQYQKMEVIEDEIQEGFRKLKETEDYQDLIKQDMKHLDNEKQAYFFRKQELQKAIVDLKGMAIICTTALALCFLLLLVLQFGFEFDTRIGYILTVAAAAVAITIIFLKHGDSVMELKQVDQSINKIILLHNSVKIRYVNNTNLLEYLLLKYAASSSKELDKLWLQFLEERKKRESVKQAEHDLDLYQQELIHVLRRYQVKDPTVWLHQTSAILDKQEMTEIRRNLIIRRQSLRRRMDYNKEVVAFKAQEEIKDLVDKYPEYAGEILKKVAEYEKKFN